MIKPKRTQPNGFTIVELLIVVVVIAILAAITIVSYNGIQSRAKTSVSLSTAGVIRDKAAAWDTLQGSYPDLAQLRTNSLSPPDIDTAGGAAGPLEAKLNSPDSAIGAPITAEELVRANNGNTVYYAPCWDGTKLSGGTVIYWDYTKSIAVNMPVGNCP
jgi:type IV pilus assembly protein PilA